MAYPLFEEAKHARGFHGRFAAGGGVARQRFRLGGVLRVRTDRDLDWESYASRGAGEGATRSRVPQSVVRGRKAAIQRRVQNVQTIHDAITAGHDVSFSKRQDVEYASPKERAAAKARTGTALMPRHEAVMRESALTRMSVGGRKTPRAATKRSFTGRRMAVRGYGAEYTDRHGYGHTSQHVKNRAGKKR